MYTIDRWRRFCLYKDNIDDIIGWIGTRLRKHLAVPTLDSDSITRASGPEDMEGAEGEGGAAHVAPLDLENVSDEELCFAPPMFLWHGENRPVKNVIVKLFHYHLG